LFAKTLTCHREPDAASRAGSEKISGMVWSSFPGAKGSLSGDGGMAGGAGIRNSSGRIRRSGAMIAQRPLIGQ
jgi:hypothetical protein